MENFKEIVCKKKIEADAEIHFTRGIGRLNKKASELLKINDFGRKYFTILYSENRIFLNFKIESKEKSFEIKKTKIYKYFSGISLFQQIEKKEKFNFDYRKEKINFLIEKVEVDGLELFELKRIV